MVLFRGGLIMEGWIKLHRKITEWDWYDDANTFRLFIHLLLMANSKEAKWRGITIKRGEYLTGRKVLADELKLTEQEIRTSLKHLENTQEIVVQSTNRFSIISICKYEDYQTTQPTTQPANPQQSTNNQPTSNHKQEGEERKEEKEISSFMSAEEFLELYHRLCPMLNRVKSLSVKRKEKVYSRLKEMKDIETVTRVLTKIGASNFCNGQNEKKWTADFDWVIKNDTIWSRAYEGKYDNKKSDIIFNVEKEKPTEFKEF